jgi:hypothetical protein
MRMSQGFHRVEGRVCSTPPVPPAISMYFCHTASLSLHLTLIVGRPLRPCLPKPSRLVRRSDSNYGVFSIVRSLNAWRVRLTQLQFRAAHTEITIFNRWKFLSRFNMVPRQSVVGMGGFCEFYTRTCSAGSDRLRSTQSRFYRSATTNRRQPTRSCSDITAN